MRAPTPLVEARVAELAREEMRVEDNDLDSGRINRKASVAVEQVEEYLGLVVPWVDDPELWPTSVLDAAATVTRELYERKDAPFGLLGGAWSQDGERARISSDPLAGVKALLGPHRQRWGLG